MCIKDTLYLVYKGIMYVLINLHDSIWYIKEQFWPIK